MVFMKYAIVLAFSLFWNIGSHAQTSDFDDYLVLAQYSSSLNCGLKPLPKIGHKIGRCVNGRWEQVSTGASGSLNCGLKPLPKIGHKIGRCINGRWEQVSY
jgi:hypothetical protein